MFILIHKIIRRTFVKIYSIYVKLRIYKCGSRLHIEYPSIIYAPNNIVIGNEVMIRTHMWFNCTENQDKTVLKIGNGTCIGRFVEISAKEGVDIGNYVIIGDRVYIGDHGHVFNDLTVPIIKQPLTEAKRVVIKDGAWIGVGASILKGVTIGKNAVVGSNAVVTKDVPDYHIARGVPAKNYPQKSHEPILDAIVKSQ